MTRSFHLYGKRYRVGKDGCDFSRPPNTSLQPTTLSRTFLRFAPFLKRLDSRFVSLRQPRGG